MRRRSKKKNVHAYIDSQNLNLGTQKMGWKLDWAKFRKLLQEKYGVTKAYLFIGYLPEYESMYNQLFELGYLIVLKPTVGMNNEPAKAEVPKENIANRVIGQDENNAKEEISKPAEAITERKNPVKGNIDAELVLYAMKDVQEYDKAIIVSGDGDFYCLVEYLAEHNKLLNLMTPNWQYSSLLKPYEKYIVRLDKERGNLAYHDYRRHKQSN